MSRSEGSGKERGLVVCVKFQKCVNRSAMTGDLLPRRVARAHSKSKVTSAGFFLHAARVHQELCLQPGGHLVMIMIS